MCILQKIRNTLPGHSQLPLALQQAYCDAVYRIDAAKDAVAQTLRVGEPSDWIARKLKLLSISSACFLTACNPWGQQLSDASNALRMKALRQALDHQEWSYLRGSGQDPTGQWPAEDSVLIWGMDASAALQWGRLWEQNAILWINAEGLPQLLWLR